MLLATTLTALGSYLLMLAAYFMPRQRLFHIPAMLAVMAFDLALPLYLYLNRDWWHRLIEQHEIFSPLLWMHAALFIAMYALDAVQILTGRRLLKGDETARDDHRTQAKILLGVRGLVILSGGMLASPE